MNKKEKTRKEKIINWAKNFGEEDLSMLMNKDLFAEIPGNLNRKTINLIRNIDLKKKKKFNVPDFIKNIWFFKYPVLRYSFALLMIALIFIISYYPVSQYIRHFYQNICIVRDIRGIACVSLEKNKAKIYLKNYERVFESDNIITGHDSRLTLSINKRAFIHMGANSVVNLALLSKKNKVENTKIKLEAGVSNFIVNKLKFGSTFSVETNNLLTTIKGTEFKITTDEAKNTGLSVKKGVVGVHPVLHISELNKLRNINNTIANKIDNAISTEQFVNKDQSILVLQNDVRAAEAKINEYTDYIINDLQAIKNNKKNLDEVLIETRLTIDKIAELSKSLIKFINVGMDQGSKKAVSNAKENSNLKIVVSGAKDVSTDIIINSPEYKYYTKNPVLNYKVPAYSSLKIFLNGKEQDVLNGDVLKNAVNGFNKIKFVLIGKDNKHKENEVNFFMNKMALRDREVFDQSFYKNKWNIDGNTGIVDLQNNKLIFKWDAVMSKGYSISKLIDISDESLQKVNINFYLPDAGSDSIEIGINKNHQVNEVTFKEFSIYSVLTLSSTGEITTQFREKFWFPTNTNGGGRYRDILLQSFSEKTKLSKHVSADYSSVKKMILYRKDDTFYSIILDADDNIIDVAAYVNGKYSSFDEEAITGDVNKSSGPNKNAFEIGNYELYE